MCLADCACVFDFLLSSPLLSEPGVIVEGTAGNTGIGLTAVGNARGYKTIIVIADTQSIEKKNTLRWGGAHLLEVPAVPFKNPLNYVHVAQRMAEQIRKEGKTRVLYADQWYEHHTIDGMRRRAIS